jgi:hypothetical protein
VEVESEPDGDAADGDAVPLSNAAPPPLLPHPETKPAATITNMKYTAFNLNFIISPLSVVAPVWTIKSRGRGIE